MTQAMAEERRHIDQILDPAFVDGLDALSIDELRTRLRLAREEEDDLSYVRRLLHGRLDILGAELEAREAGQPRSAGIGDLRSALGGEGGSAGGRGARPAVAVRATSTEGRRRAERAVAEAHLARLPDLAVPEIEAIREQLQGEERQISDDRRRLHDVIDALEGELARRYKEEGVAPPV